jgi:hypothetical protein
MALVKSSTEPATFWQRTVPEPIQHLDTLAEPDYADLFTAQVPDALDRSAEQWARATFAAAPRWLVRLIPLTHRFVLGLRLQPGRSPDYLMGWRIAARHDTWVRLEASSWFLTAHLVLSVEPEQLSMATFLGYDHWIASVIWPPVSLIHRQVGLLLLRTLARR